MKKKMKEVVEEKQSINKYYLYGGATVFIILIACLGVIMTRSYYTDKPEDIKHYEEIRDKLTLPQQEALKDVPKAIATECISSQGGNIDTEQVKFMAQAIQTIFPVIFVALIIMTVGMAINVQRGRINIMQLVTGLIGAGICLMVGMQVVQQVLAVLC